jgi:arylsulfatase
MRLIFIIVFIIALPLGLIGCNKQETLNTTAQTSTAQAGAAVQNQGFKGTIKESIRNSTPDFLQDPKAPAHAPNVLIILADDLGYSDISPYGSEIHTPNLEKLASQGLSYNNFTVTAMCSPTRAALLTGLNHHSAGVGWVSEWDYGYPGYRGEITASDVVTLPQILQQNGYATYATGKWHLTNGEHRSRIGPFNSWPTKKGFDRFWGFLEGETNQFAPAQIVSGNEVVDVPKNPNYYFPDDLTNHAIQMIKDLREVDREKPFFLYYAPGAVHAPHQTQVADREKYLGKYAIGWDVIREQRLAKQKQLGIVPQNTDLTQHNPGVEDWKALTADQQKMYARFQENYAGYVDNLDQQVGKLLHYLDESGQRDNTIVIFLSDNGASSEGDEEGQANSLAYYHFHKTTTTENLPHFDDIGSPSTFPHYPWGWVQASNTPFRYFKRTSHGGGVRVPFMISWPNGIATKGEIRKQFHHIDDLAPTLLDMLHIQAPTEYQNHVVKPMEGISFAYTFSDAQSASKKTEQYYELEANRGYYDASDGTAWKIASYRQVSQASSQKLDETHWELFNLDSDFSEAHDLADQHPEKVKALEQKWWQAARKYQVLPLIDTGLLERALYAKFIKIPQPDHMSFPVGGGTVPHNLAPLLPGKSYVISMHITRENIQQSGVIVAQGDQFSGYSLYIQNNQLVYERNAGYDVIRMNSGALPNGAIDIEMHYDKVSTSLAVAKGLLSDGLEFNRLSVLKGTASLWVNHQKVAEVEIPQPFMVGWEGLDIGRDSGAAVSKNYQSPFAFEGKLTQVDFDMR